MYYIGLILKIESNSKQIGSKFSLMLMLHVGVAKWIYTHYDCVLESSIDCH